MSGWEGHFASLDERGVEQLSLAAQMVIESLQRPDGPRSARTPSELHEIIQRAGASSETGLPLADVLREFGDTVWANSVVPFDPRCVAHLHPPALVASVVTEMAVAVLNQSMDSWDQSPAATEVELLLMGWLGSLLSMPATSSGVMTSGGTASNVLGITLARSAMAAKIGHDVLKDGLPPDAHRWRVVCSDQAHFSVQRATAQLGLGRHAVVTVPTTPEGTMDVVALDDTISRLESEGLPLMALVGTAGTTDLAAIDPLADIAQRAQRAGAWFHVDAAVAGSYLLSPTLSPLLHGIGLADSVTVDFHKLWFQPFNASALVVSDVASFDLLRVKSKYLDRGDEVPGMVNLVGRSLDTSRRFDAAKVVIALRTVGRRELGSMLERLVSLSEEAARVITQADDFEVVTWPTGPMCCFTVRGRSADTVRQIQQNLLLRGEMVLGRTEIKGQPTLKFTFMNPLATEDDVHDLVARVQAELRAIEESTPRAER